MIASDNNILFFAKYFPVIAPDIFDDPIAASRKLTLFTERNILRSAELAVVVVRSVELIASFRPHESHDFCESLSAELHRRWTMASPTNARVYWASQKTVNCLGGESSGRLPQLDAVTHDLGTTAIGATLFSLAPLLREAWLPESKFPDVYGLAKPDAALADSSGVRCFLEFAGKYSPDRLRRLGKLATRTNIPVHLFTISRDNDGLIG